MNREIKFRAWDGEKLIYPVNGWFEKVSLPDHLSYQSMQLGTAIRYLKVTQYTGLKDKNGTEIYEGDILRTETFKLMVVGWSNKFASFVLDRDGWAFNHWFGEAVDPEYCEVIGNIYDNPELLKS